MSSSPGEASGRSRLSLGRRKLKIRGHQDGDVHSDRPVTVTGGATVAGNVVAPRLVVDGAIYGSVAAREIVVRPQGQIWGDVHAGCLRLEAGGRIAGWLGDLSEEQYQQIAAGEAWPESPAEAAAGAEEARPEGAPPRRSPGAIDALRSLRSELGAALAAHAQLQEAFEEKVATTAGETIARAATLEQELEQAQAELATLNLQVDMMRQERKSRDQLTEQQEEALAATHAQLEEKETAVAALQAAGQELRTGIGELLAAKETAEAQQLASRQEVGVLLDRASSLEAALQASVQHSSEQEQSLLRWQQLADDTAAQVQMLQEEVTSLRGQLEAAEAELDGLRLRRLQQEEEGQKAEAGLQEKEAALQQQAERFRQTDGALKDALAEIEELRRSHGTGALGSARELIRTREQVSALDEELAAAQEVSRQLAEALALADDTAEAQREQLLWYKVNQDSSSQELDRARQQALQAEEQATQLKSALDEAQGREGLMETELRQLQERVDEAAAGYEAMLKSKEAQLNARDRELERLLQELDAQGQRLAQLQATLVERELELNESQARTAEEQRRLQERLKEQANLIYRMKQVTSARIAQLEAQLAQAQAGAGERANNE